MSDHTPGPWRFRKSGVYGSDECPQSLCLINQGKENCHMNGLLIAAAPDMLAALKYVFSVIEGAEGPNRLDDGEIVLWQDVAAKVESAITKAEGGAE